MVLKIWIPFTIPIKPCASITSPTLKGKTPLQALTGQTPDISHLMYFQFWEPVYFKVDKDEPDYAYPSLSNERKGRWVGFGDHVGDHLT